MYIYIDFYKKFQCIGSNCQNSCCTGWGISFDASTANYYLHLKGEFGDYLRQNIIYNESENLYFVKLTPERKCPFLDTNGLCRIYIECGEERMDLTCKIFPRSRLDLGKNSMRGFTMSCEEILHILYNKTEPLHLCAEGNTDIKTMDDLQIYELAQFIGWGMELLQDETIPISVGLATVLTVESEAEVSFKNQDYESFESIILRADDIQKQFLQAKEELASEIKHSAWDLIFGVTDTFCHILRESDAFEKDSLLWPSNIFSKDDPQRRCFLLSCWDKREDDPAYLRFLRRLIAAYFQSHSMLLVNHSFDFIYLRDVCNYLLLARVLPLTWENCPRPGEHEYFSRLSHLAHHFEQSNIVKKFVWPVIQDLFNPNLYTYIMAFIVLF